jgi:hypothetical protein
METLVTKLLSVLPAWAALLLMMGGFVFYALGGIRLGYGAAVKTLVLDLIDQAEREIQGTKRGAERKAWCVRTLRTYLDNSLWTRALYSSIGTYCCVGAAVCCACCACICRHASGL